MTQKYGRRQYYVVRTSIRIELLEINAIKFHFSQVIIKTCTHTSFDQLITFILLMRNLVKERIKFANQTFKRNLQFTSFQAKIVFSFSFLFVWCLVLKCLWKIGFDLCSNRFDLIKNSSYETKMQRGLLFMERRPHRKQASRIKLIEHQSICNHHRHQNDL